MEKIYCHKNERKEKKMLLLKNCLLNDKSIDILIENRKIIKIGTIKEKELGEIFDDINIIDIHNRSVIPGYIDNHVHITGGGGESSFYSRVPEIKFSEIVSNGVTTVVGVLGTDTITRSVENLVAKTKALKEEGITAYCLTGGYEYPSPTITGSVQKDITFIEEIIGTKMAISDHRCYNPSKEDLIRLMSETRVAGLISGKKVSVNYHIGWGKGNMDILLDILKETNIPTSLLRPTHISCNDEVFEQALILAKQGAYIDITVGKDIKKSVKYILKVFESGLSDQLTISSDANGSVPVWKDGICIGISAHTMKGLHQIVKELIMTHKIPIKQAIKLLTENPAKGLGISNKGKIEEGKDADVIVLDEKYNINSVIALGEIVLLDNKLFKKGKYE